MIDPTPSLFTSRDRDVTSGGKGGPLLLGFNYLLVSRRILYIFLAIEIVPEADQKKQPSDAILPEVVEVRGVAEK